MKKLISSLLVGSLALMPNVIAFAAEDQRFTSKVQQMISEGISSEDAQYYADLEKTLEKVKAQNTTIDLNKEKDDKEIVALTDDYVQAHPSEYRQKVAKLDKSALKKAMLTGLEMHINGQKKLEKVIEKDIKKYGAPKNFYEIKYPDGHKLSVTIKDEYIGELPDSQVKTNTLIPGEWGDNFGSSGTAGSPSKSGEWSNYIEHKYEGPSGYAKVIRTTHYWYNNQGTSTKSDDAVQISRNQGSGTSYGALIKVSGSSTPITTRARATGQGAAQAYIKQAFEANSSITLSAGVLSISAGIGGVWQQFNIFEIIGSGEKIYWYGHQI